MSIAEICSVVSNVGEEAIWGMAEVALVVTFGLVCRTWMPTCALLPKLEVGFRPVTCFGMTTGAAVVMTCFSTEV